MKLMLKKLRKIGSYSYKIWLPEIRFVYLQGKIKVMTVEAKVGWEIADGEFIWDMDKKFDNKFDAQNWVNNLLKNGNFDGGAFNKYNAGQVENIK